MKKLILLFILLTLSISSLSFATEPSNSTLAAADLANEAFISLIFDKVHSDEYTSATDIVSSSLHESGITPILRVSCSSRDGSVDCFCAAGQFCRRTETDCECVDGGIQSIEQ